FSLSESAVRSRLHRARSRLRTILDGTPIAAEAREEAATSMRARPANGGPRRMRTATIPTMPGLPSTVPAPANSDVSLVATDGTSRATPERGRDQDEVPVAAPAAAAADEAAPASTPMPAVASGTDALENAA